MTYIRTEEGAVYETNNPGAWGAVEVLPGKAGKSARAEYCRGELHKLLAPGDTVLTVLRHVSRSGMRRRISLMVIRDGEPRDISTLAAGAIGATIGRDPGIVIDGCGSDMGFELVYALGRALWPEGFGEEGRNRNGESVRAQHKDHLRQLVGTGCKFRGRNGDTSGWDRDGGYALRHRWL